MVHDGLASESVKADADTRPSADSARHGACVAYFGPDLYDAAVRRRVAQWAYAGFQVFPFAFVRTGAGSSGPPEFVSLGNVLPQSLVGRMFPLARAALRIACQRRRLGGVSIFVGRNLDNAFLALFARSVSQSSASLVYEIFDVNRVCTERSLRGAVIRRLEKWLLARVDLLIVSSPHFATAYYQRLLQYRGDWSLFENKVPRRFHEHFTYFARAPEIAAISARPWRIGWFGYLDDERSWEILRRVAESLPNEVTIHVRGLPYLEFDMARFLADVERLDNVSYGGPYRNPEDLAEVYNTIDLVWSSDCNLPTGNSRWLLTNSLYEAGYFGKPVLAMTGTAVAEFAVKHGTGWCIQGPAVESLIDVIRNLSPKTYVATCQKILELRMQLFIERDEINQIWARLQARRAQPGARLASFWKKSDERTGGKLKDTAMAQARKVLLLGFFPPPVDGQRLITQTVFERFEKIAHVRRYSFDRFHRLGSLSKIASALGACFAIFRARAEGFSALYLAPHSGNGLLLSCLTALLARFLGYSLAIHYHSYWNLGRRSWLMAIFVAICGPKAMHIVLAPPMGRDLRHFYPAAGSVATVSNCAFVEPHELIGRHFGGRRLRLGHLSNLSREKGVALVLACMRALRARGVDVELRLAGPAENEETAALIAAAESELGERLRYVGRLGGEAVRRFYQEIDIFLFPTYYRHEAEPLVVIDALAAGVPVIASDRGCIGYLLGKAAGRVFPIDTFTEQAVEQIVVWAQTPALLEDTSRQAHGRFRDLSREARAHFERLAAVIVGGEPREAQTDRIIAPSPPHQTG
jgi:glycosyltransferase involved in cell wall biosynthesis